MENKSKIAVTIGAMCMLLTCAILIQLTTIREATKIVGTSYAQQGLKEEVLLWKANYENLYKEWEKAEEKLEKTRQVATTDNKRAKELEKELINTNKLLGLTELTGSGVIVTLADNAETKTKDIDIDVDIRSSLIHESDIISIINELNNAGAEAISVNGQRVVSTTSITCVGTVVTINGVKLSSPFKISAIGSPEGLLGAMNRPGGYLEYLNKDGAIGYVNKSDNVTVAKYNGALTAKYMKTIK